MDTTSADRPDAGRLAQYHNLLVQKHLVRNYVAHSLEGGLYMGGFRFIAAETVAPTMIATLAGPGWLVALMPMLSMFGYILPQILMAHHIQGMRRHMPFVALIGVFQRLPLLIAGLVLLLAEGHRVAALTAVALAPLVSGLIAGFGVNAWQELVAKTVPASRRSSLFAVRNVLAAGIGLGAGGAVAGILRWHPGPVGFGVLHLATFGCLVLSFVVFLFVRETPYPSPPARRSASLIDNLRHMPGLLREDRRFLTYLLADACMAGIYIMMPFLGIHALKVLDKPNEYLGFLLMVHTAGSIAGNLIGGAAGDRYGGKLAIVLSQAGFLAIAGWGAIASRSFEFLSLFFLLGAAQTWLSIGKQTVCLEISPVEHRASYLAILGCINVPATLIAWLISYLTWDATHSFAWVAGLTATFVALAATLLSRVKEPRVC
jgi:predicted MFS family arabinose efflux permease